MTQYNTLNVKLSNSRLHKLKSGIRNGTEVTLNLLSNAVGDCNDESNFHHNWRLHKVFPNNSSANIKLSKTQSHKIGQSGGFLIIILGSSLKTGLPLMKNVLKPLKVF